MKNIQKLQQCSNCGACYNICPTDAIELKEDSLFYEWTVNADKCIDCGKCVAVCPIENPISAQNVCSAYGVIHNDDQVVKKSSSGGAFSAIAEMILEQGGIVYGAVFSEDWRAIEIRSTDSHTLDEIRRSKYVESKVGLTFREVKSVLEASPHKPVLYCAAPCQIAGLKHYLGKDYANLITCDFSCGGVPSHGIYQAYLSMIEKRLGGEIAEVNFRPKTYGWLYYAIKIVAANGKKYCKPIMADPYYTCFVGANHHVSVREYCLFCDFANNHYADIILADFWKYKTISNLDNDNKGISLVITNSQKGEKIIDAISKKVALTHLDSDTATYNLTEKNTSQECIDRRAKFLNEIEQDGITSALKNVKVKSPIKFKVRYWIRKFIKKK